MYYGIVYLRSGKRRPVWLGPYPQNDEQARIPRNWCGSCGGEIFGDGGLCCRCSGKAGVKSLRPLPKS